MKNEASYVLPVVFAVVGLVNIIAGAIQDNQLFLINGILWFILSEIDLIRKRIV